MPKLDLDLVKATATDLAALLASDKITSVDIVEGCLANIEANNRNGMALHGLICTAPRVQLLQVAEKLDEERRQGKVRSPLHGIPIVLKDVLVTSSELGMDTTAGSHAFVGAKAGKNASLVDRLMDAGLIILGKANLTEFCGLKMGGIAQTPGWSPVGDQTQSPYIVGGLVKGSPILDSSSPGGSSSGSAVSVAAGFAPLSLGTECCGSVILPATRAGVYAFKTAPGTLPLDGCFALSTVFDCMGALGKSAKDVADLTDILYTGVGDTYRAPGHLGQYLDAELDCLSIGFVDSRLWSLPQAITGHSQEVDDQMTSDYENAVSAFHNSGVNAKYPITVPGREKCVINGGKSPFELISFAQGKDLFTQFCNNFHSTEVHSLADIIEWNKQHAELEMPAECPNQDDLIKALHNTTSEETVAEAISAIRKLGVETLDTVFADEGVDVIVAPADSAMCVWAAAAAYPMVVVPYGVLKSNGRPFGMCAVAKAGEEGKLVRFMVAWEKVFPERPLPKPLMGGEEWCVVGIDVEKMFR